MEKEKKMIIILSILSGVLLLSLLISSGYNYKQYNDKNTCNTGLQNTKSSFQNLQAKEQAQLKELVNVINNKNSGVDKLTPEQIDCLLNRIYEKFTPFDITYNILSFMLASVTEKKEKDKSPSDFAKSVISRMSDMKEVGCSAMKTCSMSSSPYSMLCK